MSYLPLIAVIKCLTYKDRLFGRRGKHFFQWRLAECNYRKGKEDQIHNHHEQNVSTKDIMTIIWESERRTFEYN